MPAGRRALMSLTSDLQRAHVIACCNAAVLRDAAVEALLRPMREAQELMRATLLGTPSELARLKDSVSPGPDADTPMDAFVSDLGRQMAAADMRAMANGLLADRRRYETLWAALVEASAHLDEDCASVVATAVLHSLAGLRPDGATPATH